jgi:hypothetical protein
MTKASPQKMNNKIEVQQALTVQTLLINLLPWSEAMTTSAIPKKQPEMQESSSGWPLPPATRRW